MPDRTIAIACPGKSLAETWTKDPPRAEIVIGVNRAPLWFVDGAIDYWCSGNVSHFEADRKPRSAYCTYKQHEESWNPLISWEELVWPVEERYSSLAALLLATRLGAGKLVIYGMDWQGKEDWDGHTELSRTPSRWVQEARLARQIVSTPAVRVLPGPGGLTEELPL